MLPEVGSYCQLPVSLTSGQEISGEAFELVRPTDQPAPVTTVSIPPPAPIATAGEVGLWL